MKRDVVALSNQYWDDSWFRKHQFCARLARDGHRVWFVKPTHSVLRSGHIAGVGSNPPLSTRIRSVEQNLWVVSPARVLPLQRVAGVARTNQALTLRRVRRRSAPRGADLMRSISTMTPGTRRRWAGSSSQGRVVFDLVDDLTEYSAEAALKRLAVDHIGLLCERSARVVYTSSRLAQKFPALGPSAVIPNGFDPALFNRNVLPEWVRGPRRQDHRIRGHAVLVSRLRASRACRRRVSGLRTRVGGSR